MSRTQVLGITHVRFTIGKDYEGVGIKMSTKRNE